MTSYRTIFDTVILPTGEPLSLYALDNLADLSADVRGGCWRPLDNPSRMVRDPVTGEHVGLKRLLYRFFIRPDLPRSRQVRRRRDACAHEECCNPLHHQAEHRNRVRHRTVTQPILPRTAETDLDDIYEDILDMLDNKPDRVSSIVELVQRYRARIHPENVELAQIRQALELNAPDWLKALTDLSTPSV